MELNTYGDLKKVIKAITLKQKGEKLGNIALGALMGLIPGADAAKSTFDFIKAAISKPDAKKTNTWLDKLDIDDEMSAIVDDTVENGFMLMMTKTIESKPDNESLADDFNMNTEMVNYLKKTYQGRTVSGIKENKIDQLTIKSLIRETLERILLEDNSKPLQENILLTEDKVSKNLQYHLDKNIPLHENAFRYGTEAQLQLFKEVRKLYNEEKLYLNPEDRWLVENTDIGNYGLYEGQFVPLDVPMVEENPIDTITMDVPLFIRMLEYAKEDAKTDMQLHVATEKALDLGVEGKTLTMDDYDAIVGGQSLDEAKYQGEEVSLNKPKRGGSKKFFVYVKDGDKVKKVAFGAAGGGQNLAVKIRDPKARKAFAARQNCDKKKDRTTPGYWSCNIGRYWKSLGGGSNFSGYW